MSKELHTKEDMSDMCFTWQEERRDKHRLLCNKVRKLQRELAEAEDATREAYVAEMLRHAQVGCQSSLLEMQRIAARYEDLANSFKQVAIYMSSDIKEASK